MSESKVWTNELATDLTIFNWNSRMYSRTLDVPILFLKL